jgi:acetyl esterase/lipase
METRSFKTVDGHEIEADVHPGGAGERQPAVLFIHGGGLIMGSRKAILLNQVATFGEAGFRFVSIDYRLAPEMKLPEIVTDPPMFSVPIASRSTSA